jgi:pimeloyl-ACP methyl ester carboxylesterase
MEKALTFYSGPGLKLAAILELPAKKTPGAGKPGVVLCCGPGRGKGYLVDKVSHWLAGHGYAVLRFDYRGIGESEGPRARLMPLEQVEDIRNAITLLQHQPGLDPERIALWGAATGGSNAAYTAGVDVRVKAFVCVSGMGDIGQWMRAIRRYWEWVELNQRLEEDRKARVLTGTSALVPIEQVILHDPETAALSAEAKRTNPEYRNNPVTLTLETVQALLNFRPIEVVERVSPRASMWVCAGQDTLVPNEFSRSMYDCAGEPRRLDVFEDVVHHGLYDGEPFERLMTCSKEWFDLYV